MFGFKKKSYGSMLIEKLGFEDASIALYSFVLSKFNTEDNLIFVAQLAQFVREEFDAASQGNDYSRSFVRNICSNSNWYKGAMGEESEYPIDGHEGPQQAILNIILPMINEDAELAVKLRCHIVEMIYEDYQILMSHQANSPMSAIALANVKKRSDRLQYLVQNGLLNVQS